MIGRKIIKTFAWLFAVMGLVKWHSIIKSLYLEQPELIDENYIPVDFFNSEMITLYYFLALYTSLSIASILVIKKSSTGYSVLLLVLTICIITKIGVTFYFNHYRYVINHKLLDLTVDLLLFGIPAFFLARELKLFTQASNYLKSKNNTQAS